jgi:hypothetical protein
VARAPGALLKGPTTRPLQQLRARALVPIHPNAWNRYSQKFAFTEFYEVRPTRPARTYPVWMLEKDTPFGGCP